MAPGFRIVEERRLPSRELVAGFAALQTAIVSDNLGRMAGDGGVLRPVTAKRSLCGAAFTVRARIADNLMIHKAIDMAGPGDVLVVAGGGDLTHALFGEIMYELAVARGIAGVVVDGAIRDSDALAARDEIALLARGVSHRGPYKDGPGTINEPVPVGDLLVRPGDIVLGDGDGLVAVPLEDAEGVLAAARAQEAKETETIAAIRAGRADRSWVDQTLRAKGVIG
jgi:regulator of RNase E activity RraA